MTFFHHWYVYGIKLIKDIIDKNGKPMSPQDLHNKYGIDMSNYLEYYGLIGALPKSWKKTYITKVLTKVHSLMIRALFM